MLCNEMSIVASVPTVMALMLIRAFTVTDDYLSAQSDAKAVVRIAEEKLFSFYSTGYIF